MGFQVFKAMYVLLSTRLQALPPAPDCSVPPIAVKDSVANHNGTHGFNCGPGRARLMHSYTRFVCVCVVCVCVRTRECTPASVHVRAEWTLQRKDDTQALVLYPGSRQPHYKGIKGLNIAVRAVAVLMSPPDTRARQHPLRYP